MGDHFVLLVDRLLTESTLDAAIESRSFLKPAEAVTIKDSVVDSQVSRSPTNLVECRICQDEDVDSQMESPCSCSGSLKYAHRNCVQKWCNEKGDTTCEICHQQFKPGYTAPPPIIRVPMSLRGNWRISRRDLNNRRIIAMVSTDDTFLNPDYEEYAASTSRNIARCHAVATILMIFLILRHTLPIIINLNGSFTFPMMMLVMLKVVGIVLPICMILKTVTSILRRQQQESILSAEEYSSSLIDEQLHHVIAIH